MRYNEKLLERTNFVLARGSETLTKAKANKTEGFKAGYPELKSFKTIALSFILDLFGKDHLYYVEFAQLTKDSHYINIQAAINIIDNIKSEIENGWLSGVKAIVSAEIFSDFMDMANHLLEKDYEDAAAVMIGSVLEEHIRQLCLKHNINITRESKGKQVPLKADSMNNELVKANVYNILDQKSVTTNLDLRNKAAHGKYDEYDKSQVELMYSSVLNFMTRHQL